MRLLPIAALALLAAPAAAKADYPPDPETLLCPPTSGDLDYALDRTMTAAGFQEDPHGGLDSWRTRKEGPFHLASAAPAEWLKVEFKRFPTAEGTRVVADLRWQTRRYEFGVKQAEYYATFQEALDGLQSVFPCRSVHAQ